MIVSLLHSIAKFFVNPSKFRDCDLKCAEALRLRRLRARRDAFSAPALVVTARHESLQTAARQLGVTDTRDRNRGAGPRELPGGLPAA